MDLGFFGKYTQALTKRKEDLEEIIVFITQETGVMLFPDEIHIKKNSISFQTSSVKKIALRKKSVEEFLKAKGYIVKF